MPDAAITFFISLVLLLAFLAFRLFESRRGIRYLAEARESADTLVSDMYRAAVTGDIPRKYQDAAARFLYRLAHETVMFLVESLRAAERSLSGLSYRLRRMAPPPSGKEPSAFLKAVAPEKRVEDGTTPGSGV